MRRTALYLGGLFLATGATLAMSGPALAADGKHPCPKTVAVDYGNNYGVGGYGVGGYGYGGGYGVGGYVVPTTVVPVAQGYGYGGGTNISSYEAVNQVGLVNLNKSPISLLGSGGDY